MRFSMNSYLLGVGTVVGALAFGFGGGILLTKTAIKEQPAGPSRIERVARPEPASPQVQVTEARAVPVPRADPAPAVQPALNRPRKFRPPWSPNLFQKQNLLRKRQGRSRQRPRAGPSGGCAKAGGKTGGAAGQAG